ncbi:SigE family RNA polymerase sigma factor [Nocardioides ferulae]|uniref:SigE family RNA polymerase sigma factor n=1 Tax=Nocardioides ferulae TaxID=2340821 RepID=UPI000EB42C6F|nr:SigE family RNA polymerase sigma factor [Nocardioides ferulae]
MPFTAHDDHSGASAEERFNAFVVARTPALSRTAYLLTGDAHLAEDLVQTALFKAARSWHRIEGDPEPYVRRILYTQNVSWWRSRRRMREHALPEQYDAATPAADPDLRLTLEQALGRLTTRQRTVLVLRYFEDLTEVQAAEVLGIGAGTVKSIGRQALARLRTLAPELAELVGEPAGGSA